MPEPLPSLLVVGAVVMVVLAVAYWLARRERLQVAHSDLDLGPLRSGVTLFSDVGCGACDEVRAVLTEEGVDFEEFRFDHHRRVHEAVGVTGVPLVVVKGDDGSEVGRLVGRVRPADVRRLVGGAAKGR